MIKGGHTNMNKNNQCSTVTSSPTTKSTKPLLITSSLLLCTTALISTICMNTTITNADDSTTDTISINVSAACTLSSTNTTHTATVTPGQWTGDIGQSDLTAVCNDPGGYAIYAIGYTNDEYGNTNLINTTDSTKTIATGPNKSGNTSNWSMKLGKGTGESATIEGETSGDTEDFYTDYHIIPSTYTKVAKKTDATSSATAGTSLTTTYGVYTTTTQLAGTYNGQVKYTLVHPHDSAPPVNANQVGVTYEANGSTFPGGSTINRVVYTAQPMYIANTPQIAKSPNVADDGTQNGAYEPGEIDPETGDPLPTTASVTVAGAVKLKVVLKYGVSSDTEVYVYGAEDSIWGEATGVDTYTVEGDTVTINMYAWEVPETGYDYGFWAQVYPIYYTERLDTTVTDEYIGMAPDTGTYATTTDWYGSWYTNIDDNHHDFTSEDEVTNFVNDNIATLSGTTINLTRGLSFTEAHTRAGTATSDGHYVMQDFNSTICPTVAVTQTETVIDTRDDNTYMIGKLKGGSCWMLDNLALDPTDSATANNMNQNNTNAPAAAITNYLNGGSSTTGWSNVAVANKTSDFVADNNGYTAPQINNQSKDTLVTSYGPASTNGQAKVGIYYNYCAATVGTYCYGWDQGVSDAQYDICPANWRMPTGGASGEYQALYNNYNTTQDATNTASLQYNLSTPLSGEFNYNSARYQGRNGRWWSSTGKNAYSMYGLSATSSGTGPQSDDLRYYGLPMRCIAQ